MSNYTIYHLHTDYSNCVTNIDSATKIDSYVEKAKKEGMKYLGVADHGANYNWYEKKKKIEEAGMVYIHAAEFYITEKLNPKIRDNAHCILLAKNKEGFKEINKLISISFNRNDGHFYYVPRISMDELESISDNIMVTTACLANPLNAESPTFRRRFLEFLIKNKENCYLEVQHHLVPDQIHHNKKMLHLSKQYGINLIVGTDTHSIDETMAEARLILQKSKKVYFTEEEGWDLTFKTYDELVQLYRRQGVLSDDEIFEALENTNRMASRVEPFEIDKSPKYPKLYENSDEVFEKMVFESIDKHPYALKNHSRETILKRIEEELPVFKSTGVVDFMLFKKYILDWEKENGIHCGPGRGSVSGSFIAYLLGITEMDSIKFDLNFFRFLNPYRVTNLDIDTDYYSKDRDKVREFLLTNPRLKTAEIITFGTIATRGAIRDVGRALEMPLKEVDEIAKNYEDDPEGYRKKYPKLFKYVDLLSGVITHSGIHAAGVLCSDLNIDEEIGLSTSSTTPHPVSNLDMYCLDECFWVKLDCLGLDNLGVINETCRLAGIEIPTPDSIDLDDTNVWNSIKDDTTAIFQWESSFANQIIKSLFSEETIEKIKSRVPRFSYLKLFSFGNGLIRPGCASFRDDAAKGIFKEYPIQKLNELLAQELGYLTFQETIMKFLVEFCGYSPAESDNVRRAIAKKKGTEELLPEIERRFIEYSSQKYGVNEEICKEVIKPFIQTILEASDYAFNWAHSDAYSFIGYACGYLRYYYPLEFITSCLNIFDTEEKTASVIEYAKKRGIKINPIKFRYSRAHYFMDRTTNTIYKGVGSVKYLNDTVAEELYELRCKDYGYFTDLLYDLKNTSINSKQLEILIKLGYFEEFNKNSKKLLHIVDMFNFFKKGEAKQIKKDKIDNDVIYGIIAKYSKGTNDAGDELKNFILDELKIRNILYEVEEYISNLPIQDFTLKERIQFEQEFLGYISPSQKDEEKRLLLVTDIKPLYRKRDNKRFGSSVFTTSLGSGKKSRLTLFDSDMHQEIKKGDVIKCLRFKVDGEYFTLLDYELVG